MNDLLIDYLSTKNYYYSGCMDYNTKVETRNELRELSNQMQALMPEGIAWDSKEGLQQLGLSLNQARFVIRCWARGLDVYPYSGRGMYGEYCPAVNSEVEGFEDIDFYTDDMGMKSVNYARY